MPCSLKVAELSIRTELRVPPLLELAMQHYLFVIGFFLVLSELGCVKKQAVSSEKELPAKLVTAPSAETQAGKAIPEKVPPIDLKWLPPAVISKSKERNRQALVAQKAKQYQRAVDLYIEALVIDPGNVMARYNLATAFELSGKSDEALSLLEELAKQSACRVCQGRLVRARKDPDLLRLRERKAFTDLTAGASVEPLSIRQASERLVKALVASRQGEVDRQAIAALVHPRIAVDVVSANYNDETEEKSAAYGTRFLTILNENGPFAFPTITKCDRDCCQFEVPSENAGDMLTELSESCFSRDSGGVLTLRSISFGWGF